MFIKINKSCSKTGYCRNAVLCVAALSGTCPSSVSLPVSQSYPGYFSHERPEYKARLLQVPTGNMDGLGWQCMQLR